MLGNSVDVPLRSLGIATSAVPTRVSDLIATWCELDARGIEIVTELAARLGRDITPVGMNVELFSSGKKYAPNNLAESVKVARKMVVHGHPALRDLAKAIVESGGLGLEQENLYDVVPPVLASELAPPASSAPQERSRGLGAATGCLAHSQRIRAAFL